MPYERRSSQTQKPALALVTFIFTKIKNLSYDNVVYKNDITSYKLYFLQDHKSQVGFENNRDTVSNKLLDIQKEIIFPNSLILFDSIY